MPWCIKESNFITIVFNLISGYMLGDPRAER